MSTRTPTQPEPPPTDRAEEPYLIQVNYRNRIWKNDKSYQSRNIAAELEHTMTL
jgi:hypothetical protein